MLVDQILKHEDERVMADCEPLGPPWGVPQWLVPWENLLVVEGIIGERTVGTMLAGMINQQ